MNNSFKLRLISAVLVGSVVACKDSVKTSEQTSATEAKQTAAANNPQQNTTPPAVTPTDAASTPSTEAPAKTPEPKKEEYMRIGKFDPTGKYSLAMKKNTTDIVIADQRGMITPIPFDTTKYSDVSFSDPSSSGLTLIVANRSESQDESDLGPVDFELFTYTVGGEKSEPLAIKLPGKQLLNYAVADNRIALASANKTKKGLELKITVTDKTGKKLGEFSPNAGTGETYEMAVNAKGDVFALVDFGSKKRISQPILFKDGKEVTKLKIPSEILSGNVAVDSMDADGNVTVSKSTQDTVERLKFNAFNGDGKVEKLEKQASS